MWRLLVDRLLGRGSADPPLPELDAFDWPGDWTPIGDPNYARALEVELARSAPRKHALRGRTVRAVASGFHSDDVLFAVLEEPRRWAEVHLTWNRETDPAWPATSIYDSLADWVASVLEEEAGDESCD